MGLFKRPNDVWLRLWLIIVWAILGLIDGTYLWPWASGNKLLMILVHPLFFGPIITIILIILFQWLKRPDCVCWNDIELPAEAKDFDCPQRKETI